MPLDKFRIYPEPKHVQFKKFLVWCEVHMNFVVFSPDNNAFLVSICMHLYRNMKCITLTLHLTLTLTLHDEEHPHMKPNVRQTLYPSFKMH